MSKIMEKGQKQLKLYSHFGQRSNRGRTWAGMRPEVDQIEPLAGPELPRVGPYLALS